MTNRHLLSLLQNNFRTVHVIFENNGTAQSNFDQSECPFENKTPHSKGRPGPIILDYAVPPPVSLQMPQKSYVYKCHNDLKVEVGSRVVVMTDSGGLKIVTVVKVDDFADIDLTAEFSYKWIVDVVCTDLYNDLLDKEAKFTRLVTEAERAKLREQTLESFKSVIPATGEAAELFHKAFQLFEQNAPRNVDNE